MRLTMIDHDRYLEAARYLRANGHTEAADHLAYCASMAAARESITPAEWRRAERAFTSSGSPRLA